MFFARDHIRLGYDRLHMGADFIGWRNCPLQQELGAEGFLGKLKLRAYKVVIEERVPADRWSTIEVVVRVTGRPDRQLSYDTICSELAEHERGIPECARCPLSSGRPLGCYRYVTYPVDAITERLLFEFFTEGLEEPDSIADQLNRDIVSQVDQQTGWYEHRGPEGTLAELQEPLAYLWGDEDEVHRVDSAQVLAAMFVSLEDPPLVVAYARFWRDFFDFVEARLAAATGEAQGAITNSRTLHELRGVASLLAAAVQGAMKEGWTIVVDG